MNVRTAGHDHYVLPMDPTALDRLLDAACRVIDFSDPADGATTEQLVNADNLPLLSAIARLKVGLAQYREESQNPT
jgi:hypothetical protein